MRLIYLALPLTLQAFIAIVLTRQLGPIAGVGAFAALVVAAVLLAGGLIRHAPIDRVTWRNRVAGLLLPWSMILGGGSLKALLIKNMVAGTLFGICVITIDALNLKPIPTPATDAPAYPGWTQTLVFVLTVASWITLLIAWLWILRIHLGKISEPISTIILHRRVKFVLLAPPIAIAASIALRYFSYNLAALLIVGLPLLIVLGPLLLMTLLLLSYAMRGKPIRWN